MADLSTTIKIAALTANSTTYSINTLAAVTPKIIKIQPSNIKMAKESATKLKVLLTGASVVTTYKITDDTGKSFSITSVSDTAANRKIEIMAAINASPSTGFIAFEASTPIAATFFVKSLTGTEITVVTATNATVTNSQYILNYYDETNAVNIEYLVDSQGLNTATDATVLAGLTTAEATLDNLLTATVDIATATIQPLQLFSDLNSPTNGIYSINGNVLSTTKQLPALAADGIRGVRALLNKNSVVNAVSNPNALTVTVTGVGVTTTIVLSDGIKETTLSDSTSAIADRVTALVNKINTSGANFVATGATGTTFDLQSKIFTTISVISQTQATNASAPTLATRTLLYYNFGKETNAVNAEIVTL